MSTRIAKTMSFTITTTLYSLLLFSPNVLLLMSIPLGIRYRYRRATPYSIGATTRSSAIGPIGALHNIRRWYNETV